MTISEQLFEKLCKYKDIEFQSISLQDNMKSADYRIWLGPTEIVVEVKEIDSKSFQEKLEMTASDASPAIISDSVRLIRNKFDKAKKQLQQSSNNSLPTLFVLFDSRSFGHLDNEDFLQAMYGDETVTIQKKQNDIGIVNFHVLHNFGRQKKVGVNHNRSVSGFCNMIIDDDGEPSIDLFHNLYARIRLDPKLVSIIATHQFELVGSNTSKYQYWREL